MNKQLEKFIPSGAIKIYRKMRGLKDPGFFGDYKSWIEAKKDSTGYDDRHILDKVSDALLKVKNGEAKYERDSVLFNEIQYSFPLLSTLLLVAIQNDKKLDLIDFGGSLGSSYFQNRSMLEGVELKWKIVWQRNFVERGKKSFAHESLKFFKTIGECRNGANLIILSSVLQYLEDPYSFLKDLKHYNFEYIFIDKTPFFNETGLDCIKVQRVTPTIYEASYPVWFLDQERIKAILEDGYIRLAEFDAPQIKGVKECKMRGMLYRKKR